MNDKPEPLEAAAPKETDILELYNTADLLYEHKDGELYIRWKDIKIVWNFIAQRTINAYTQAALDASDYGELVDDLQAAQFWQKFFPQGPADFQCLVHSESRAPYEAAEAIKTLVARYSDLEHKAQKQGVEDGKKIEAAEQRAEEAEQNYEDEVKSRGEFEAVYRNLRAERDKLREQLETEK